MTLTRIVEEALLNTRKHARAKKVRLALSETPDRFYLAISDNGQGFDRAEAQAALPTREERG